MTFEKVNPDPDDKILNLLASAQVLSALPMPKSENGASFNACGAKIQEAIELLAKRGAEIFKLVSGIK